MIIFGSVAFASCVGYMMYMRHVAVKEKKYVILDENDRLVMKEKKSRWDEKLEKEETLTNAKV